MANIGIKRGTEQSLIDNNPVLTDGELIFSTDSLKLKVSDGVNSYSNLPVLFSGIYQPTGNYSLTNHSHGNITSDGKIGSIADRIITTTDNGLLVANSDVQFNCSAIFIGTSGDYINNGGIVLTPQAAIFSDNTVQETAYTGKIGSTSGLLVVTTTDGLLTSSSGINSSLITNFNTSVSGLIDGIYAKLNSPSLTGVPTAPTAASGTNNNQIASTSFVRTEIANLVDSAPSTLDTLNELAAALGDDANFSTTVTNSLANKANLSGSTFTGLISGPSGNFASLTQNNVPVSVSGHTHVSSDLSNFNSSVSGVINDTISTLLQAGSYISLVYNSGTYTLTISATGLQPSGSYASGIHYHISSDITNFNNAVSGLLPVTNITAGTNISISSNSGNFTINSTAADSVINSANLYLWSNFT